MRNIEILAPVGNLEMLYAAIAGGADAVYLAGSKFGARAYADNFTTEDLVQTVRLCHFFEVKVFVTVNTLIKESELKDVMDYIAILYKNDVDAIIIQDLGLAKLVKDNFPDLQMHASTQLSANSISAVNYLESLGFSRVVLARELSLHEIKEIKANTNIQLEVFIHGSLCVSYSGKCLMSSMIGGRSGNRGRCAQPCRKKYDLLDPNGEVIIKDSYLLSPLDLGLRYEVKDLINLEIDSLKIEGRLKKPEYVYSTSKFYSEIKNEIKSDESAINEVSNRGFTRGAAYNSFGNTFVDVDNSFKRGTCVGTIEKRRFKGIRLTKNIFYGDSIEIELKDKKYPITSNGNYQIGEFYSLENFPDAVINSYAMRISSSKLRELNYLDMLKEHKKKVDMQLNCYLGKPAELIISIDGVTVNVFTDEYVEPGKKLVVDYDYAKKQLSKLGDSWFDFGKLLVKTDQKSFLSSSQLNKLRRLATEKLYNALTKKYDRKPINPLLEEKHILRKSNIPTISVSLQNLTEKILKTPCFSLIDRLYIKNIEELEKHNTVKAKVYYVLPQMLNQSKMNRLAERLKKFRSIIYGVVVHNSWEKQLLEETSDYNVIYSKGLNIFNSKSVENLSYNKAELFTLSPELNLCEIADVLNHTNKKLSVTIYERIDEMLLYHCPASPLGCDRRCNKCKYKNGYALRINNDEYIFYRQEDLTIVKNKIPTSGLNHIQKLMSLGVDDFHFDLDEENIEPVLSSVRKLINGDKLTDEMKRSIEETKPGHFERGVL